MSIALTSRKLRADFSQREIDADTFAVMRRENLARWPTGALVDLDSAVARHKSMPKHKQLAHVFREAEVSGKCLTQPRGGFGTLELQIELMTELDKVGLADIVPTTTDSYTRNEQWDKAQGGVEESRKAGRSMLNGFPMVNYGPIETAKLIDAIDKPAIVLSGTSFPRLTAEVGYAAGFSGYLGSGLAYTVSYTKETSLEEGIRNYQYLDRLAALYLEHGVELHRRQPGFLTGTNIPPSIAIITAIIDALLAANQGVRHYGLELGQTMHLVQDAAAIRMCRVLVQEYLQRFGFMDMFTPITSLHWMGAWPHDESQSAALIVYGGTLAAVGGANSITTKSTHEAFGIPTPKANAEGLRMTRMIAGRTEQEVYAALELAWVPPELREARREFDWAKADTIPKLLDLDDLRGDLHMHTTETDGKATLEEMVAAARARGLQYIAITDHSKRVSMARGLDATRLRAEWQAIDKLNKTLKGFRVLKGIEVDILEKGGLDLDDDVLSQSDWVVASVHYGQNQPREQITKRVIEALENPWVSAIAHPTGRLINRRKSYEIDLEAVFKVARDRNKMMEINANPRRLDLDDVAAATAKSLGIPIVISSDAHSTDGLGVLRYGVLQARRAGLTAHDVANTRPLDEFLKMVAKGRGTNER